MLKTAFEDAGFEMAELECADDDVWLSVQNSSHHSGKPLRTNKRLLSFEAAIAYLKVLGMPYEAATLDLCLQKEGLLSQDKRILKPY